jgi:alpha-tubulin suppressor-like RCC1 family protein
LITSGCAEDAESPVDPEADLATTTATSALAFRRVSYGMGHTCGVTTSSVAYCWGSNEEGQLGDGTTANTETPVPVAGGLLFRDVTAGDQHTCGLALNDLTYCWGYNSAGQVGDETTTQRLTPTRVHAGGLRFRRVSAGAAHNCGETADNRVYCWGYNDNAQLGSGTTTGPELCSGEFACSTKPRPVVGDRRFRRIFAGRLHTCGITPLDVPFCWGDNSSGQLGNGMNTGPEECRFAVCSTKPVKVAGGLQFRQISGGTYHTCGVTTDHKAYCWGTNDRGLLGNGTYYQSSLTPTKVREPIRFRMVSAGGLLTCGISLEDVAYCWGPFFGAGTTTDQRRPAQVVGGLFFRQLDVGATGGTCGVSTENRAYCWGSEPVPVPDPT